MLSGESMVRAWPFDQLLKVVRGTLHGLLTSLASLLVLFLTGTVGSAIASILVPLCLALEVVKDRSDYLLA